jgi:hypothetical protein
MEFTKEISSTSKQNLLNFKYDSFLIFDLTHQIF